MSNIQLILDALMVDVPPNIAQDLSEEVWDARHALDMLLLEHLAGNPDAQTMIDRYREQPDVYGGVLAEALVDAGADEDAAVVEAAGEVMSLVAPLDSETDSDDLMNVPGTYSAGDVGTDHV